MEELKVFCVLDGALGSVFSVVIDANKSVAFLKKTIKKEKKNDLKDVDAYKLQLFLTKKGDGWLPSKELLTQQQEESKTPVSFGKIPLTDATWSIQDVLIENKLPDPQTRQIHALVVIPQGTSARIVSQDGIFKTCSSQFFLQFPIVDEVNGWLEFASIIPLTKCRTLYIRSSYRVIADKALMNPDASMVKYAVITGTPGVGKSVFMYYVMWKLIKAKKRVLLLTTKPMIYFDGEFVKDCTHLPDARNGQFWSPDLWCLVDSVDPTTISGLPILECSTLLASTPRQDCIGEFKKLVPTPDVLYMPLWTKDELAAIAPLYPHAAAVWRNRFEDLGGVPRVVLQDILTSPQALLKRACNSCSLKDCMMLVSIHSESLIHIRSEEPYQDYSVWYASELAMQVIVETKVGSDRRKMQNLLDPCDGNSLTQALRGYIFEPNAMDLLERGGSFVFRELTSATEMERRRRKRGYTEPPEEHIDIPKSPQCRQIVERVEGNQEPNQLYVPRTSNYVGIDAWMPNVGGFQMTVGKTHTIKSRAVDDLAKLGPNGNRLYFLLPPLFYKKFTKKTPQSIDQYAVLIPYPKIYE